ncbi:hypothetical protein HY988_03530 [Candidatus Micrarchaeota archaeon]|nr:hypothetical protein [Candidatus Micrarchaeota archaeon]
MKIKESKPVSGVVAKEILEERKKENELGYEQGQALENLEKFTKLTATKAADMVKKLVKEGKVSPESAIKIVDVGPTNPAVLKAILSKDKIELSDDEITQIIKEFA